jgi:metal-sulfur cluster biosynthetic enzyme
MTDKARVLHALAAVRDPELDQSLVELGFVHSVDVDGDSVSVTLRLPTYYCAPNFAYLMASDAHAAVETVQGIRNVTVLLEDHFASAEISHGLAHGLDFDETFPTETSGQGLHDLRDLFRRKAFIARQARLCRSLEQRGVQEADLTRVTLRDLPRGAETNAYLARRRELAIDTRDDAPFLVTADGTPIPANTLPQHLRFARTVSVSIEGNASFCRGLLQTRYGRIGEEGGA